MKSYKSYDIKKTEIFLCYSIIYILFGISVCCSLRSQYLTGDGAFTFSLIHKSFSNIIRLTAMDVHPFLYYFMAKVVISPFSSTNEQIFVLRILSAFPYLLLLIIGNTTIKKRFGKCVSWLFMFFIVTMPLLNSYIYILRMYSWSMLFITLVFIIFIYIYKNYLKNNIASFLFISLFALCASYCHYYSLIILSIIYILFFILFIISGKKVRYIILSIVLDIILYSPWLFVLFKQTGEVKKSFWSSPINLRSSASTILDLFCPKAGVMAYYIFSVLIIISLIFMFIKSGYNNYIIDIGFLSIIITTLIGIIISIAVKHRVVQARYLMPALGMFWLSVSFLIYQSNISKIYRKMLIGLLIFVGILSFSLNLNNFYNKSTSLLSTITKIENIPKNEYIVYGSKSLNYTPAYHLYNNIFLKNKSEDLDGKVFNTKYKTRINIHKTFFLIESKSDNLSKHILRQYRNRCDKRYNIYAFTNNSLRHDYLYKISNNEDRNERY